MDVTLFIETAGLLAASAALAMFFFAVKSAQAARLPAVARRRAKQRR